MEKWFIVWNNTYRDGKALQQRLKDRAQRHYGYSWKLTSYWNIYIYSSLKIFSISGCDLRQSFSLYNDKKITIACLGGKYWSYTTPVVPTDEPTNPSISELTNPVRARIHIYPPSPHGDEDEQIDQSCQGWFRDEEKTAEGYPAHLRLTYWKVSNGEVQNKKSKISDQCTRVPWEKTKNAKEMTNWVGARTIPAEND